MDKKIIQYLFVSVGLSTLVLILYLYFGDDYMKRNCHFKILILLMFLLCFILVFCALFCNDGSSDDTDLTYHTDASCNINKDVCFHKDFVLIHNNRKKNKTVITESCALEELLKKAKNGDTIIVRTDEFRITPDMLKNGESTITLVSKGGGMFRVLVP